MKYASFVTTCLIVLSFGGCVINWQLTQKHAGAGEGPGWFEAVCSPVANPAYNCDAVLQTKWAFFSLDNWTFEERDPDKNQRLVPVALLGWFYFSALLVWFAGIGQCSYERRWWHLAPAITVMLGSLASAYFLYVMFTQLDAKCLWCMIAHLINFLMLVGVVWIWPGARIREAASASSEGEAAASAPTSISRPNPSVRQVVLTVIVVGILLNAELLMLANANYRKKVEQFEGELKRVSEDTESQLAIYWSQPKVDVPIREDDPVKGSEDIMLQLVVFSDFQCPSCRSFDYKLREKINPAFDNRLQVYWKHYPICTDCNPYAGVNLHPQACVAAAAGEAARIQGGNDAFWKAHDWLFRRQSQLARVDYRALATELNLDPDKFIADMESQAVADRIREDIELGKKLDIKGTPAIVIGGRLARSYMIYNANFMAEIKRQFDVVKDRAEHRLKQQQAQTQPAGAPTPSIPDPPNGP